MSTLSVARGYANVGRDDLQLVHYYRCGSGPAVFLLHASPASGASFLPLLPTLGEHVTAIALDTPGYGFSDSLPTPALDLDPYADALDAVRSALGIDKVVVYGSATGAQIALEYSKRYAERCAAIILDNCADFPDAECQQILDGYFPDLSIDYSGAHLTRIWTTLIDLHHFFPWHWHDVQSARQPAKSIDPNIVQLMALQYLQAGPRYDEAYRAAFANERLDRLLATQVPTTIIRSAGSLLSRYTAVFDDLDWPANFVLEACGATPKERWQAVVDAVVQHSAELAPVSLSVPVPPDGRRMLTHPQGNLSATLTKPASDRWLLLHDIGSSSAALAPIISAFGERAQVLAPDLPGHGASDFAVDAPTRYLAICDEAIAYLLAEADFQRTNVLAIGEAASVALHAAEGMPERFEHVVLLNPLSESERSSVTPVLDGTHLIALWHQMRNSELYCPLTEPSAEHGLAGAPNLDPEYLNRRVVDRLLCVASYESARADIDRFPAEDATAVTRIPVTIARTRGTAAADRSERNFANRGGVRQIDLPQDPASWIGLLGVSPRDG